LDLSPAVACIAVEIPPDTDVGGGVVMTQPPW